MYKPRCHEAFTLNFSSECTILSDMFSWLQMPKCKSSSGASQNCREIYLLLKFCLEKICRRKKSCSKTCRHSVKTFKPTTLMTLKQGDTSPEKFNLYCWEPALNKTTPFLSAWYSYSRNADVTVAGLWSGCCRKNKEIIHVRNHPLV